MLLGVCKKQDMEAKGQGNATTNSAVSATVSGKEGESHDSISAVKLVDIAPMSLDEKKQLSKAKIQLSKEILKLPANHVKRNAFCLLNNIVVQGKYGLGHGKK